MWPLKRCSSITQDVHMGAQVCAQGCGNTYVRKQKLYHYAGALFNVPFSRFPPDCSFRRWHSGMSPLYHPGGQSREPRRASGENPHGRRSSRKPLSRPRPRELTQYASKFGKLSSGQRAGKGQFSFQSQTMAMPKNAQTTAQLYSSHIPDFLVCS